jgi:hypothetical protein
MPPVSFPPSPPPPPPPSLSCLLTTTSPLSEGLRRLIQIKNKELRHMKTLAATILEQRSELEQFFLESLSEVKAMIAERKKKSMAENLQEFNHRKANSVRYTATRTTTYTNTNTATAAWPGVGRQGVRNGKPGGTFPNIKPNRLHHLDTEPRESNLPSQENEKVYLHELQWEDKELVLRLLFAKMNGSNANMNHAVQNTKRSGGAGTGTRGGAGSSSRNSPVFISEGKGLLPTEEDGQEYFTLPGYGEGDLGAGLSSSSGNLNYAVPMEQLHARTGGGGEGAGYEFGEEEGSKVRLA